MDTDDEDDILFFNGLNGDTGNYLFDPVSTDELARDAQAPKHGEWPQRRLPYQGLPMEIDSTDVSQAGWAIVFPTETSPRIREALQPLIEHRQSQIPDDRCKVLEYKSGQGLKSWLKEYGVHAGAVVPSKVPFYLLLVGDPTEIPFSFQCLLDIEYAVGRLTFDEVDGYHHYAQSVVRYEKQSTISNAREVAYWGVRHDPATRMSADYLISPLHQGDDSNAKTVAEQFSYTSKCLLEHDATRSNLFDLFKDRPPTMLCTASHGLGWKMDQVDGCRQRLENGALCSQDWSGEGPLTMDHYITGQDFTDDLNVHGMVAFMFACYGIGTPEKNHFLQAGAEPETIAERPFVSAIPQRLLGHPKGGALAVMGHYDMAWSYSFKPPKIGQQLQPFRNMIGRVISGQPVGNATKDFSERYAALCADLLIHLDRSQTPAALSPKKLARMWIERNDAQNYILLGDPAAKVRADAMTDSKAECTSQEPHEKRPVRIAQPAAQVAAQVAAEAAGEQPAEVESGDAREFAAAPSPRMAPPQLDSKTDPGAGDLDAMPFFLGALRALRAQAQYLLAPLRICQGIDQAADDAEAQFSKAIADAITAKNQNMECIEELRQTLYELSRQDAEICDWCSDEVTRIENHWRNVDRDWPHTDTSIEQARKVVEQLVTDLDAANYLCGKLTIPRRVDQHLESLRIGQAFDFHQAFRDELPEAEDRVRVLKFMADHPAVIAGIVDAEAGVVFRASRSWRRRILSFVAIIGLAAAGFGLIAVLDRYGVAAKLESWSQGSRLKELSGAYALLVLGAICHVIVGSLKQAREKASAGLIAIEDWLLWCHIRETSLVLSIVYLWIGLLGMALVFAAPVTLSTAFFVGYSIDSFVDLFLQKFSARAEKMDSTLSSAT